MREPCLIDQGENIVNEGGGCHLFWLCKYGLGGQYKERMNMNTNFMYIRTGQNTHKIILYLMSLDTI